MGRREYAILLILARLGLRAGEIKTLTLEDLDWQEGWITVRGKAGRYSQLPLPADVGEAIADYLRNGRPTANSRCVFLRTKAPAGSFKSKVNVGSAPW
jgi:integrase/recombinase XerD